jgi:hypothetical protein
MGKSYACGRLQKLNYIIIIYIYIYIYKGMYTFLVIMLKVAKVRKTQNVVQHIKTKLHTEYRLL